MGTTLLIIDSDPVFRENLSERLKHGRWKIRFAGDRMEAEKRVKRGAVDVALLGLASLRSEGLEILKMIKRTCASTEVIMIGNYDDIALSIQGMKLGAFDDFMGPFEVDSLMQRIQDALKQRTVTRKRSFLQQCMNTMAASAFAESGEHGMAVSLLKQSPFLSNKEKPEEKMENIKVLLVDDEEEFVKSLAERIKMRKLGPEIALNGEAALQIVNDQVPDVMVLDLKMPGIDGMEVLRRVKKAYPKVEVIILTGHGSEKDEKDARRLGAFDYLQKPVDIDHLVQYIKRAYQKKIESSMAAAAFAEAGEFDTACNIIKEEKEGD